MQTLTVRCIAMEYTCLDDDSPGYNHSDVRALTHRWRFKRRRQVDYPRPLICEP